MLSLAGGQVEQLLDSGDLRRATALPTAATRSAADPEAAGVDTAWPVTVALQDLLPAGALRRGSTVTVIGSGSLLFALVATASRAGA